MSVYEETKSFMSRKATSKIKPLKEKQDEMAQKYKNISIFSWYTPEKFVQKNKKRDGQSRNSAFDSGYITQSCYGPSEEFEITRHAKEHGNVPMLRNPSKGIIPYQADT